MAEPSGWETWHDTNARCMQAVVERVCELIAPASGEHLLDVACGTGLPALALAERVGPQGSVLATDVSPDMVAAAERVAQRHGAKNITFRPMSAEALAVPDASFDAVTCCFGLMFSPDPPKAARELWRTLRPGGRVAVTVWDEPAKNPLFTTTFGPLRARVPAPPPDPRAPSMFGLADRGALERLFGDAGFEEVRVEPLPFVAPLESVEVHWRMFSEMAPPLKAAVQSLPPAEVEALRAAVADAVAPYVENGRVALPAAAIVVSARR
jgi:SAM-dependent methyltransferase